MRTIELLTVAIVMSSIGSSMQAQGAPGMLVRVSHDAACCESPLVGTVVGVTADSILIRPGDARSSAAPIALSRRSVRGFERGERVGAHAGVGAIVGFLAGGLAGGAIGTAAECQHCDGGNFAQPSGLFLGGLVGILSGILIGSRFPNYAWEQADVPHSLGIMPGPRGDIRMRVSVGH